VLAPILGDVVGPTRNQWKNFSPELGLAWAPSQDGKNIDDERALLGRPGLGRQTINGTSFGLTGHEIPHPNCGARNVS
jgi:hypothetical protein